LPIPALVLLLEWSPRVQVMEVLKLILRMGELLAGEMALFDGGGMSFRKLAIKKKKGCRVCSV